MKAKLHETTTTTLPEQRIWIVELEDESDKIGFTFTRKAPARAFKAAWDDGQPMITVLP